MTRTQVAIFAHQEERRIAGCINSLPLTSEAFEYHLLVNGTTDRTAAIARSLTQHLPHFHIHDLPEGGKARTWNYFVDKIFDQTAPTAFFVDGDAEILPGALESMTAALQAEPKANGVNALPIVGRAKTLYQQQLLAEHGLFGALYGLRGSFLSRLKSSGIRLPLDLIGDDGLVAALAKTDLNDESYWDDRRIANCVDAGFRFEVMALRAPSTWLMQWQRFVTYSVRRYQNRIISNIMSTAGPSGLPKSMPEIYATYVHLFDIRLSHAPFDWLAKRKIMGIIRKRL
jgi:glycosyltransferase involved in cell wall biosynthesis